MSYNNYWNSYDICWFYNPYFKDGCSKGKGCEYLHLHQSEYEKFVQSKNQIKSKSATFYGFKSAVNKFHQHRYYLASQIFKSLLKDNPHIPQYNLWCARTMEKMSLFQSAEVYYRKAISTQPKNATFHGRYATLLHMKLNRLAAAKKHYEIGLNLRGDINALHCHYGKLLCDLGGAKNHHKAQYHFTKCLQIYERDEECHFYFGQLLYKLGDMINAEKHIKQALCLQNKAYIWHYYHYALICVELSRFNEAKQYLQICLDLQYVFKSMSWGRIYFEYGLLLMFIFSSYEMGLKYIGMAINSFSKKSQSQYVQIYETLKNITDINSFNFTMELYHEYRQSNKDKEFIDNNAVSVNKAKADNNNNKNKKKNRKNKNKNNNHKETISEHKEMSDIDSSSSSEKWDFYLNNNDKVDKDKDQLSDDTLSNLCLLSLSLDSPQSASGKSSSAKSKKIRNVETVKKCSVENEFCLFLKTIDLENYYNKFKNASINDIRLIEHIDHKFLSKTIGMTENEIICWMNNKKKLKSERLHLLNRWKKYDRFLYTLFYDIFCENGVLTIQSFLYYFKRPKDILYLVSNNYDHAKSLWELFQNIKQNDHTINYQKKN